MTAIVTSTSITSGDRAYDRYCAVAHTTGRPVVPSIATMAAASPQPPNRNPPPVEIAGRHRQEPAVRVVGRLQPEELPSVHRRGSYGTAGVELVLHLRTLPR